MSGYFFCSIYDPVPCKHLNEEVGNEARTMTPADIHNNTIHKRGNIKWPSALRAVNELTLVLDSGCLCFTKPSCRVWYISTIE
jgi:hypothetical protein